MGPDHTITNYELRLGIPPIIVEVPQPKAKLIPGSKNSFQGFCFVN